MKNKLLLVAAVAAVGGTGLLLAGTQKVLTVPAASRSAAVASATAGTSGAGSTATPADFSAGPPSTAFQRIAKAESAAVVNVNTSHVVTDQGFGGDVPDFFFHGFGGGPWQMVPQHPQKRTEMASGSGFIIDKDGYILTNRHVVDDADRVWVTTADGKKYDAKVVGRDARTDVAVLKIKPRGPLTVLPLGNSDSAEPGEWVMAVGNPFGLGGNSVSVGVVSYKGRPLDLSERGTPIEMIQTDAAINPGNSGGPLINARGEAIGINTLIMTQGLAQNSGVGFAVPINVAKAVLPQLREKGHVTRGWLGLQIQSLNEDLAASMNLKGTEGALVSDVKRGGPAEEAGVKAGDVIRTIDGSTVHDSADLTQMVAALAPRSKVKLGILRDGSEKTLTATLGTFPEGKGGEASGGASEKGKLGLSLSPLDEQTAGQLDMPRGSTGLVVQGVEPGSPAELAGLRRGDVIVSVNGHDATSADQLTKATEGNHPARLRIYRDDGYFFLVLKPAESDSSR